MSIQEFKQKYGSYTGIVVHHFITLGANNALKITDADIKRSIDNAKREEENAEKEGKFYLLDPDFVGTINEGARDLARLLSDPQTKDETYNIIARNLVSESDYLDKIDFRTIQLEYWKRVIKYNAESLNIDGKNKIRLKELADDYAEDIAWAVINDDAVWDSVNSSIDYELKELLKKNK